MGGLLGWVGFRFLHDSGSGSEERFERYNLGTFLIHLHDTYVFQDERTAFCWFLAFFLITEVYIYPFSRSKL